LENCARGADDDAHTKRRTIYTNVWERLSQTTCLILDVLMPGMNGLELQHALALKQCPIPIIFITGHGDESTRAHALRAGAANFLAKPFSEDALLTAVQSVMRKGSASRFDNRGSGRLG